jgi:hypothetical protein
MITSPPSPNARERNRRRSAGPDLGALAAGFAQLFLRSPVTYVQESAAHSPKWFKRTFPRTYYHLTLRQVREWTRHLEAEVHFLSFPKCGRTWLRRMLGRVLVRHFELGDADPVDLRRMSRLHPAIPTMHMHHDDDAFWKPVRHLNPRRTWYRDKRVVLLVREPKDVIVSAYFQKSKREKTFSAGISRFLREEEGGIDTLIEYYNIWHRNADVPRTFLCISYEQLHADAAGVLRRVLDFLEFPDIPDAVIDEAVAHASFARTRRRERGGEGGSATPDEALKARRGKVGGHVEQLSSEEIDELDEHIRTRLLSGSIAREAWTAPPA